MSADFLAPLVTAATESVEKANAIATEVNGAKEGSQAKSLKEWRENNDHAAAKKYRENVEKAQAAILKWREEVDKIAAAELKFAAPLSEEEISKKKEEYKEHASSAKKALGLLKDVAETLHVEAPEVPALLNFGSGKPAGERTGSTGTRTRWSKVEFALNGGEVTEAKRLSDFVADVKKVSGVSISAQDVSKAIFEEAGTTDPDKITDCNILWSETDKEGKEFSWSLTVYRDPKNVSDDETSEESDSDEE
jgi:hypothetical protein